MQKLLVSLAATASLVALFSAAAPAHAGFVTFVSGNGADGVGCGVTPAGACREIFGATGALAQTDEGGIIHVLPGEYIAFPVEKGVDIVADAGQASIYSTVAGGGGGIVVNVSGHQVVRIRGFLINSAHGIVINSSGVVHIEDSTLMGVEGKYGIVYAPAGAGELYVSRTTFTRPTVPATGSGGIQVRSTGSGSAKISLDHVDIEDNQVGILVDGGATSGPITMNIRDSEISGSGAQGLGVFEATSGGASAVVLERTTISSNGAQGIVASRALASVRVRQSAITGNTIGVQSLNGGQIISHGDNVLAGNTTNGAFTSTVAPQ